MELEKIEAIMGLMTKYRVNKVQVDALHLEITHFPMPPLSAQEIKNLEMAKAEADTEALLWSSM